MSALVVREYGSHGPTVIAVHGGPAAAGGVAPLARKLGSAWRVLEPFQRGSSENRPLTVAAHVQDLADVVHQQCGGRRPLLVGHSWGAMLSLAYAAAHPDTVRGLVLIGCGTFTQSTRAEYKARLSARMTPEALALLEQLRSEQMPIAASQKCGHTPWLERQCGDEFYAVLGTWISSHSPA